MKKIFILISLLLISQVYAQGRGPAIEPGRGISIDQYDHSKNKNDPGFNWNESNKGRSTDLLPAKAKTYRKKTDSFNKGSLFTNLAMTAIVMILPIVIWFTVLRRLGETEEIEASSVVSLDDYRSSIQDGTDDDHDDNIPKAS